jgi:serine protease Do
MGFRSAARCRGALAAVALACLPFLAPPAAAAERSVEVVEQVKPSIVAVGTYQPTRSPQFAFRGTGFVVGDGTIVVTNAHVLPDVVDPERKEVLGVLIPQRNGQPAFREASRIAGSPEVDLALLRIPGPPLPAMRLRDGGTVREGQSIFLTGFPIGAVLGAYPATHRGIVAAIVPIAIPQDRPSQLDAKLIRRLTVGAFDIYQLDATAYPGNSGSPVYDPENGDVIGIVNMVLVKGTRESALSQPSGITYAVPVRFLRELLDKSR